jgi:hypothetical protein
MSDGQEDSHPEASSPAVADTSSPSSVDLQSSTHDDDCPVGGHKHDDEGIEHATADGDHEEDEDDEEDEEDENDLHASLSASTEEEGAVVEDLVVEEEGSRRAGIAAVAITVATAQASRPPPSPLSARRR